MNLASEGWLFGWLQEPAAEVNYSLIRPNRNSRSKQFSNWRTPDQDRIRPAGRVIELVTARYFQVPVDRGEHVVDPESTVLVNLALGGG